MNARAEEFDDSDSFSTNHGKIIFDANSGTAFSKNELLTLQEFGGPRVPWFYESNTPPIRPRDWIDLGNGVFIFSASVPDMHQALVPARVFTLLQDCYVGQFCFAVPPSEASTLPDVFTRPSEPPALKLDWSSCLAGFVDEEIEDGMTAALGERISNLIRLRGSEAIKQLKELIASNDLSPSVVSHLLRWLGRIKNAASFDSRLKLLCENLRSESAVIRDGASLGLAALGSPKAISFLQKAIDQEKVPELRADMEQVLRELQY
jgi:HEAT repeats